MKRKLSPEVEENLRELEALGDEDIDLSDMPEQLDWTGAERGRFHRSKHGGESLVLEPELTRWFKAHAGEGGDWRARVNRALKEWVERAEREAA